MIASATTAAGEDGGAMPPREFFRAIAKRRRFAKPALVEVPGQIGRQIRGGARSAPRDRARRLARDPSEVAAESGGEERSSSPRASAIVLIDARRARGPASFGAGASVCPTP